MKAPFSNTFNVLPKHQSPALVLGDGITALGTIRSLGRLRIPVLSMSNKKDFVCYSRWYRKLPGQSLNTSNGEFINLLQRFDADRGVLFPCSDSWVKTVASLPEDLKNRFPSTLSGMENVENFLDKEQFEKLLSDLNIPHPYSIILETSSSLDNVPKDVFSGLFLKPRNSQAFFAHYRKKAFFCETKKDAQRLYKEITENGFGVILQEFIPGPPSHHYFIDGFVSSKKELQGLLVRKRLRMYPPHFGNSTYMVSVEQSEAILAISSIEKLIKEGGLRGVFSAEFKLDHRDGKFKLLEVNIRPWWYVDFATHCGVNVCQLAYADCLNIEIEPIRSYRIGEYCIFPYYDYFASKHEHQKKYSHLISWARHAIEAKKPIFSWNDPLPSFFDTKKYLWSKISPRQS